MQYSLLIKPASADCNLRCPYCFYLDRAGLYPEAASHRMSDAVLERVVRAYLGTEQSVHAFVWQGGEPLLMGLPFFERVTDLQMAYAGRAANVSNAVQTNGVLITDALARHFRACRFLVGVSLDGPEALHDAARVDLGGVGSYARTVAGIERLKRCGAAFNLLALVGRHNEGRAVEVYEHLVSEMGAGFVQFIECVELDGEGRAAPYSVTPEGWGRFLCEVFDHWYARDTRKVSVRLFDTILAKLVEGREICCTAGGDCRQYFVIEYNGDVYPCDFHVLPELRLGNVMIDSFDDMASSPVYRAFGERKSLLDGRCSDCVYFSLCKGDCPKNRIGHAAVARRALSYLCPGWKMFYAHALPKLQQLADQVRRERRGA
jgi:uncharacterized protein